MKKINIIIIILLIIPFQLKAQRQQVIEPTNLECWYSLVGKHSASCVFLSKL